MFLSFVIDEGGVETMERGNAVLFMRPVAMQVLCNIAFFNDFLKARRVCRAWALASQDVTWPWMVKYGFLFKLERKRAYHIENVTCYMNSPMIRPFDCVMIIASYINGTTNDVETVKKRLRISK